MSDGRRERRRSQRVRAAAGALAMLGVVAGGVAIAPAAVGQTATQPAAVTVVAATVPPGPTFVASVPPGAPAVATATATSTGGAPIATTAVATATSPAATATPAPTRGPEGFRSSTAVLGDVVWARAVDPDTGEPDRKATGFITTDPVIYAAIPVERIVSGVTISVTWTYDGQLVPELSTSVTTIADARPGWLLFHLDRPADQIWPVGGYVVDVYVDGQFALTADVIVRVPPS